MARALELVVRPEASAPLDSADAMDGSSYPLHVDEPELGRLRRQHAAWLDWTRECLDGLGLRPGARVLELGAGPGLVTVDLARRVGPGGRVVALDASPTWLAQLEHEVRSAGLSQVEPRLASLQDVEFEPGSFDAVHGRWFWSFVPEPELQLARVARWVAPGGVLAIQDYHHEGIALAPRSRGFEAVVRGLRAMYAHHGGDAFVAARVPRMARHAGLQVVWMRPLARCARPGEELWGWAEDFFPRYAAKLLAGGWISADEHEAFQRDWAGKRGDEDALFFAPVVVSALLRVASTTPDNARSPSN